MASEHRVRIIWEGEPEAVARGRHSRAHEWHFDGGVRVPASASPHVVPPPLSREDAVDPEEAFVASLSSCHMLTFVDLARREGLAVVRYDDEAVGRLERVGRGHHAITRVDLRPRVDFAGSRPEPEVLRELHRRAHEACFIAASVTTEVVIHPDA